MCRILGILLGLTLLSFNAGAQAPAPKPEQIISLLFSSNVQGEVEPCG
jgi:hypothetical protein